MVIYFDDGILQFQAPLEQEETVVYKEGSMEFKRCSFG
jgi:hypothetical protein